MCTILSGGANLHHVVLITRITAIYRAERYVYNSESPPSTTTTAVST